MSPPTPGARYPATPPTSPPSNVSASAPESAYNAPRTVRQPAFQRANLKARRVQPPPDGIDLTHVAESCRYVGSPYHKDVPGFAGVPHRRPTASLCPRTLAARRHRIQQWLRDAVRSGRVGAWDGGYPRYVWHREGDILFEARHGSPGSGEYHGYPLEPSQTVRGLE